MQIILGIDHDEDDKVTLVASCHQMTLRWIVHASVPAVLFPPRVVQANSASKSGDLTADMIRAAPDPVRQ